WRRERRQKASWPASARRSSPRGASGRRCNRFTSIQMARKRKPTADSPKKKSAKSGPRRSLEESLASLAEGDEYGPKKNADGTFSLADHHAGVEREGDHQGDISFFRTGWKDTDLSNLTLPRRYINRSSFEGVSFVNSDLNQSFMCWNDFIKCDFTDADLT